MKLRLGFGRSEGTKIGEKIENKCLGALFFVFMKKPLPFQLFVESDQVPALARAALIAMSGKQIGLKLGAEYA